MYKPSIKSFFKYLFVAKVNPLKTPDKGSLGEGRIFVRLDEIEGYHKILTNVYLTKENIETTEIDIIFITQKGIFVIESKNYTGLILGRIDQYKWMQMIGKNYKKSFLNPIIQNEIHINACLKLLNMLNKKHITSYIVFGRNCNIENIDNTFPNGKVLQLDNLIDIITEELESRENVFHSDMVDAIYNILKKYSKKGVEKEHIKRINEKYNED